MGTEKNKGGLEDGKCSVFSSHCGDRRSFVSETENMCFRFRSTPADLIGHAKLNRRAANILILFVLHKYIGAADQLAPIYWCCKHFKNLRNFKTHRMQVILCLLVLLFPQYIGEQNCAAVLAAPIIANTDMLTTCDVYKFSTFLHI